MTCIYICIYYIVIYNKTLQYMLSTIYTTDPTIYFPRYNIISRYTIQFDHNESNAQYLLLLQMIVSMNHLQLLIPFDNLLSCSNRTDSKDYESVLNRSQFHLLIKKLSPVIIPTYLNQHTSTQKQLPLYGSSPTIVHMFSFLNTLLLFSSSHLPHSNLHTYQSY